MAKSSKPGGTLITLILLAAIAGGAYWYWKLGNEKPPEIITTTVTRGDVIQSITATGILEAPTSVDVSSQISGKVLEVLVDFNSPVKEGDILARIDPATYESRFTQAEAQLANTQANYTLTNLNTERTRELFKKSLVSQQDLDQAEALLKQADAQLAIQRANVSTAKVDLERCTITAPITGIVLDRQTEPGKTVAASLNAPTLFTLITDLTKMQISADVSEADIGTVAESQDVTFTVDAYPERQFRGKVSQIRNLPKTAQSVVVYSTIIDVDNRDLRLKPGMTANVSIITARRDNVLKIANAALRARIPEALLDGASGGHSAAEPALASREQIQALMQETGVTFTRGQPIASADLEKLRKLASERGLVLPENFGAGRFRRRDADASPGGTSARPTPRTVYLLAAPPPNPKITPREARFGISDGTTTEVVSGLEENDIVVTNAYLADGTTSTASATSSPFQQQRFRR
ncbi:MAG: efflux RND transporter periplasmic adaptor subunit [Opitutaceae bacterium]|jgi:HlyD family secretion protein|nr:efflux RND transporter periplasmic adaptor subunit [Opitutaceae bacterium]